LTDRLGLVSAWAGQHAFQPLPDDFTLCRRRRIASNLPFDVKTLICLFTWVKVHRHTPPSPPRGLRWRRTASVLLEPRHGFGRDAPHRFSRCGAGDVDADQLAAAKEAMHFVRADPPPAA